MDLNKSDVVEQEKGKLISQKEIDYYLGEIFETIHEPLIILDKDLRVLLANQAFYKTFKVTPTETTGKLIYELGNKQWNIPELRRLLEEILPDKKTFDNFEVTHVFENIGKKRMILNARQLDSMDQILLTIENNTEIMETRDNLLKRIDELERYKKATVGRELKMIALKEKLKENE